MTAWKQLDDIFQSVRQELYVSWMTLLDLLVLCILFADSDMQKLIFFLAIPILTFPLWSPPHFHLPSLISSSLSLFISILILAFTFHLWSHHHFHFPSLISSTLSLSISDIMFTFHFWSNLFVSLLLCKPSSALPCRSAHGKAFVSWIWLSCEAHLSGR